MPINIHTYRLFATVAFSIFYNISNHTVVNKNYIRELKFYIMAIVKVIEVISTSTKGIEDAVESAVTEVSKSIRNIDSVYVKDIKAHVKDGKITTYGVICQVSFRVENAND